MSVYHNCLSFLLISAPPLSRLVHITHHKTTPYYFYFYSHITHHKTTPHDCYFYSHITRHHLIIILSTHYTISIIYCLINTYIRWIPNVKMCTSEAVELSKHVHLWKRIFPNSTTLPFWADSLVPSLDGAGSVNVNARNLPSDEVCKESLISSAA